MTIVAGVSNSEAAVILNPGSYLIGAVGIGEELKLYILQRLVVGQANTDGVIEVYGGQAGCLGGDGGQSGNDLVFHHVASRTGSIVLEAVIDVVGAVVLAGVLVGLTDGLFQSGNTGLVLGVYDYIVIPEVATLGRSGLNITGNGGHGQGYEEGVGGAGNHFRHAILNDQVQANRQVALDGLTVVIGQVHVNGIGVVVHVGFQSILNDGGVLSQSSGHCLVQDIGLVEPELVRIILSQGHRLCAGPSSHVISILIAVLTVGQTDCSQQFSSVSLVESVQQLGQVVVGMIVVGRLREGPGSCDVGDHITDALDGITVAGLAIAQGVIGRIVVITLANCVAQDIFHVGLTPAGADERVFIPYAILHSVGPVVLPNSQGTISFHVDGSFGNFRRMHGRDAGEQHSQSHAKGQNILELFHCQRFLSLMKILMVDIRMIRGQKMTRGIPGQKWQTLHGVISPSSWVEALTG